MMRMIVKHPGEPVREVQGDGELAGLQATVGGWIELLAQIGSPAGGITCYVNEEGRMRELPYNFTCGFRPSFGPRADDIPVLGPAVFVGCTPGGDARDLTDDEVSLVLGMFGKEIVAP